MLARGSGLTAAVLAGALVGHCLAGGHVPGPAVLAAIAALLLVVGVLGARSAGGGRRARTRPRVVTVLASAGLAVALHPVLAMLATAPAAALVDPHASHGAPAGPAAPAATEAVDLSAYVAAGIDLDAVRAAGTDLDALVAAGLDPPTLAAAGLDPADPHAPHTVAALVAAADRAAAAASDGPAGSGSTPGTSTGARPAADAAATGAGLTVAGLRLPEVGRQAATGVTLLVTVLLAGGALALPADGRRRLGASTPSGPRAA